MARKQEILTGLKTVGMVAAIRADQPADLIDVARALARDWVTFVKITMTVPKALTVIQEAADALKDEVVIGAGTILESETARAAILAGAGYIVSPALRPAVIETCRRYAVACMPGAMPPTEVLAAWGFDKITQNAGDFVELVRKARQP